MTIENFVLYGQWVFLAYFVGINAGYLMQNVIASFGIRRYLQTADQYEAEAAFSALDIPISLVVPAYNESSSIITSVKAMLQLEYPDFELIVVNDGSKDDTLQKLVDEFGMQSFPEAYRARVPCADVKGIYRSTRFSNLRVVDKVNGGSKADASNAGINACRYPLVCVVDADSILQPDSLRRVVRPFLEDSSTIAVGGTVRIANGCLVRQGFLEKVRLPRNFLALVQVVEYLRAFLFGRMGWSPMNALLIISGAFGVFHKETLVEVGGYNPNAVGEDMELILRMHRLMKQDGRPYRITFIPDPVCWTDAPENLRDLKSQRVRWQHGLGQALMLNRSLIFNPKGGTVSWIAIPFYLVFELMGPVIEVAGYFFIIACAVLGWLAWPEAMIFLLLAISLGMLLSTSAIMLEELSFHMYSRTRDLMLLYAIAILENFGFRQLTAIWRLQGLVRWLRGGKHVWETLTRSSSLSDRA
ncbi:MAG: glycosyltransferase family 2 protein [Gammaproteobacteria bacterium]|nr:glycosyltransferase family 2 protein [Gammaproteobacteria bacterium]MDH4315009.1 glycosyltransferase family 2 protein [Gammaproteobacteria bacterium]MDH5215157.1 glycosyltransferase family 2 protein [Gammaproteobacteria bacterium]